MEYPEGYIDATLATLRANLPGAIQAENAAHSDFNIPTPDDAAGYFWGVETTFEPPAVEVAVAEDDVEGFSIQQYDANAAPVVLVRAWLAIDEQVNSRERLARANYRLGRAVTRVLVAPNAFGQGIVITRLRRSWRVNPETRESETLTGSTLLAFQLDDVETYGG